MDDVQRRLEADSRFNDAAFGMALANDVLKNKMKPLAECRLYAFVDTTYLNGRAPELIARQLCDGGADLIQLRAKQSSPAETRRMAEKILPIPRAATVGLVIHDD